MENVFIRVVKICLLISFQVSGTTAQTAEAPIPGDVNGDGKVDCADLQIVKQAIGKKAGQAGFDSRADVVPDGIIDVRDLAFVAKRLPPGAVCQ